MENDEPAKDVFTESNIAAWKIPKVTAPGGLKINKGQRKDPEEANNQSSALRRGSGRHGGSAGFTSGGRGNGNERGNMKTTGGSSKVNRTQDEKKKGIDGHTMVHITPERSGKKSRGATETDGKKTFK